MDLDKTEKEKYEDIWGRRGNYRSASALPFARFLNTRIYGRCLDIGCGDCTTLNYLNRNPGIKCEGLDITIGQCNTKARVHEAPVWDMPFDCNQFKFTFSTDVLEHLPTEKVEEAIIEISDITEIKTIHQIATFQMRNEHLTVQPIEWWNEQFEKFCKVPFELQERIL
jgi:hypothetical protein